MKKIETGIEGLFLLEPMVYGDDRGFFMETYNRRVFQELGLEEEFVQDNHSKSVRGVVRGLHFQRRNPQGKLVRVIRGAVLDVAVDLRKESATYGKWEAFELSAQNKRQLYIPPRFAHGFLTLEADTEFVYKCTSLYDASSDGGIRWDDPTVGVDWQLSHYGFSPDSLIQSDKDKRLPLLSQWEGDLFIH